MAWRERATTHHHGFITFIIHTVVRFLQFILALTVLGLYGQDLNAMRLAHIKANGDWVFAEVVGGISAITALVFMLPCIRTYYAFVWDLIIFILWVAVFGIFGKLFIKEDPEGDGGIERMKHAVWVDLVNMLLWLISTIYGAAMFFGTRGGRSLHTGRANV